MKTIIALLVMVSAQAQAGPKFKAGDCVTANNAETWEELKEMIRILEVGKRKYRYEAVDPSSGIVSGDGIISLVDDYHRKVDCPKAGSK